jgi:hypothetical protein
MKLRIYIAGLALGLVCAGLSGCSSPTAPAAAVHTVPDSIHFVYFNQNGATMERTDTVIYLAHQLLSTYHDKSSNLLSIYGAKIMSLEGIPLSPLVPDTVKTGVLYDPEIWWGDNYFDTGQIIITEETTNSISGTFMGSYYTQSGGVITGSFHTSY